VQARSSSQHALRPENPFWQSAFSAIAHCSAQNPILPCKSSDRNTLLRMNASVRERTRNVASRFALYRKPSFVVTNSRPCPIRRKVQSSPLNSHGVSLTLTPSRRSTCAAHQTPGVARSRDMCALGGHKYRVMVLAHTPLDFFLSPCTILRLLSITHLAISWDLLLI
jgi:hypothetical protein